MLRITLYMVFCSSLLLFLFKKNLVAPCEPEHTMWPWLTDWIWVSLSELLVWEWNISRFQILTSSRGSFAGCCTKRLLTWTQQWHHLTSFVEPTKLSCTQAFFFFCVKILSYRSHPWHPIWHKAGTKPPQVIKALTSNNLPLLTSIVFF